MAKFLTVLIISALVLVSIGAAVNSPPGIPTAPQGPAAGVIGEYYTYTTSAIDPDGNGVKYVFFWGDGTASFTGLTKSGTPVSASHKWKFPNTYGIYIKAIDSKYAAASQFSPVTLVRISATAEENENRPPLIPAVPTGPVTGSSGIAYSYGSRTTDPDGDLVKYTFDWGDGTTSATALITSGSLASMTHTWTVGTGLQKTFNVSVKATDEHGLDSINV